MNLILILNRNAGTLRGLDPEAAANDVASIFREHGHEIRSEVHAGADAIAAIERGCGNEGIDAVIVGGGDGTISAAAAAAARCGMTLGILPLGTMNLFARSLGVPLEMKAAAEALAKGTPSRVDIGEVNGRYFVHVVALGLHQRLVSVRDRMTYRSRFGKMRASVQAWWIVVHNPPRIDAEIRADKLALRRVTSAILVSNNPLGEGHLPYADDPRLGALGLYVVKSRRLPDLLKLTAHLAVGAIGSNPHLDSWRLAEVEIALPSSTVEASVDGEIVILETPLRCRSHRGGLKVLRPGPDGT